MKTAIRNQWYRPIWKDLEQIKNDLEQNQEWFGVGILKKYLITKNHKWNPPKIFNKLSKI